MKRISIFLAMLLTLVVAACSSEQASPSAGASEPASATAEPTPEATPEETAAPPSASGSTGGIGTDSALLDLLPDSLGGNDRTDLDLTTFPAFTAALQAQGMNADDVEYVVSTYGTGSDVVTATAMRIPGLDRPALEQMARMMTGATDGAGSAEVVTVGGKEVIAVSTAEQGQVGYMYFTGDGVFIIGSTSEDLVEELLSQLP